MASHRDPSWHLFNIDPVINDALRTVTGCLCPTPADNFLFLGDLTCWASSSTSCHLLHSAFTCPPSFKPRHPYVPATQQLISSSDDDNWSTALWADRQWNAEWLENTTKPRIFPDFTTHPPGMALEQRGSGLTATAPVSNVCTPAFTNGVCPPSAVSGCSVLRCRIHRTPHGVRGLTVLDNETIE